MITPIHSPWEPGLWQQLLSDAYRDPRALLNDLGLPDHPCATGASFPTLVPRGFAARMRHGDPHDPLLRQVLPVDAEDVVVDGYSNDPLAETDPQLGFTRAPGLIQKYAGRALLITTPGCAVHCRYCFRRHFPYADHRPRGLDIALDALADDTTVAEVILSGGDPLLLQDTALANLLERLDRMPHIERLRVHTRLPVVLPERITRALIDSLTGARADTVVVIHANHATELDAHTARALGCLREAGIWLLNQSVLLAGVNDSAPAQIALARVLFTQGVLPYYLHLPDRVAGTHHFDVTEARAVALYREMQAALPGYLLARLAREAPGRASKMLVNVS